MHKIETFKIEIKESLVAIGGFAIASSAIDLLLELFKFKPIMHFFYQPSSLVGFFMPFFVIATYHHWCKNNQ
jgi:hypothetical protein